MTIFGMSLGWFLLCLLCFGIIAAFVVAGIRELFVRSFCGSNPWHPYRPPLFVFSIDISERRQPRAEDLIDEYLIENGLADVDSFREVLKNWVDKNPPPRCGHTRTWSSQAIQ